MPLKSFTQFLTEVQIIGLERKGGWGPNQQLSTGDKPETRGKKVSAIGKHHDVYKHEKNRHKGESSVSYHVVHRKTGKTHVAVHGTEYQHEKGGSALHTHSLAAHKRSTIKAHDVYHHLLKKHHNRLISSSSQSEGGHKTWQRLIKKKGVKTHAWKPDYNATHEDGRPKYHAGKLWNVDVKKKGTTLTHNKTTHGDKHGKSEVMIVAHRGKK